MAFSIIYTKVKDTDETPRPLRVVAKDETVEFYERISGTEDFLYHAVPSEILNPYGAYQDRNLALVLFKKPDSSWEEHSIQDTLGAQAFIRKALKEDSTVLWHQLTIRPELG